MIVVQMLFTVKAVLCKVCSSQLNFWDNILCTMYNRLWYYRHLAQGSYVLDHWDDAIEALGTIASFLGSNT